MSAKKHFTTLIRFPSIKSSKTIRPKVPPRPEAKESRTVWLAANGRQTVLEVRQ
ncbi:MAG: hypothetical protein KJ077_08240 [Anaerolineae bacterium]|nr:hypothetical protein [Anaerolineae bacterium]